MVFTDFTCQQHNEIWHWWTCLTRKQEFTAQSSASNNVFNLLATQFIHYLFDIWLELFTGSTLLSLYQDLQVWIIFWEDNPPACSVIPQLKYLATDLLQQYDRNKTVTPWTNEFCVTILSVVREIRKTLSSKYFNIQQLNVSFEDLKQMKHTLKSNASQNKRKLI